MSDPPASPRLRSALYMPGSNERALGTVAELEADALILDLEDAVAPAAKTQARDRVRDVAAAATAAGQVVAIRINGIDTPWHDGDLRAAARAGPAAVLVPKVNAVADILAIEHTLEAVGAPPRTRIWAMLETPAAILNAGQIAAAGDRLAVLVMGTNDLAAELHAVPGATRLPLLASLSICVLAARSTGKAILDGVFNDVRDLDGLESECTQGRELGFDGKTLIHPGQIETCNRVFSPSEDEVRHAHRVIEAFEAATASDSGVATVDGKMIENLHVEQARRTLEAVRGARTD